MYMESYKINNIYQNKTNFEPFNNFSAQQTFSVGHLFFNLRFLNSDKFSSWHFLRFAMFHTILLWIFVLVII